MSKRHLITAALPYANGPVHIGHLAGCYLPADIYTRYLRLKGEDVLFICGTDEHGVAITIKAKKEGTTPQGVVDKYYGIIKKAFDDFGIGFDHFSRTSREIHHHTAQEFFTNLYDKGVFEETETEQYYDEEARQFLADRYITGTCPKCGNENAYGDQCEKCGSSLSPLELINPRSMLSNAQPVLKKTKNWFLRLDEIAQDPAFLEFAKKADGWKVNVKGQFQSWLNQGLQPRAMTRDLDWGIDVPVAGAEGKKLYVWFDAPIGYISATKEYFANKENKDGWELYWKDQDTDLVHFIGKDNIVFHTIIFPMMLLKHGDFILPANVPANEFLNLEGDKISTSRDWAVWLHEYLLDFPGKTDELRYTLTSIAPETKDSDFSWKDYQLKVNSELVAILGNFVNRVMVLTWKFFDGKIPVTGNMDFDGKTNLQEATRRVFGEFDKAAGEYERFITNFQFRDAQAEMIQMARAGNKFLQETEPWKLFKEDPQAVAQLLYDALRICYGISVYAAPFLPVTSAAILRMLNETAGDYRSPLKALEAGKQLQPAELLFRNVEDEAMQQQLDKLQASKAAHVPPPAAIAPAKPEIQYEDFAKIDLRVAKITAAVKVPKADKLLQLTLDTGIDTRTVVSGIAEHYAPESIVGKYVTVLVNLAPRKLRGIESQGMILMADNNGKLLFVQPEGEATPGSGIS